MSDSSINTSLSSNIYLEVSKEEFLRLIKLANREIVYNIKDIHFFIFDGITFITKECKNNDFSIVISGYKLSSVLPFMFDRKKMKASKE